MVIELSFIGQARNILNPYFATDGEEEDPRVADAVEHLMSDLVAILADHDRRVAELLAANTAEVERRRAAEAECARLSALIDNREREASRLRATLAEKLRAAEAERDGYARECDEVEQVAGKALGYPLLPDSSRVCVGDHVPATIAAELAERRRAAEADRDRWHKDRDEWCLKAMSYADDSAALRAAYEHAEEAEALAERMWPIVEAVAGIKSPHDFAFTIFPNGIGGDDLIQTAVALVREREEMET